ncbi:S8 family peptidase [Deinococcus rubellus]|uniref:S8 family peptidase n=1 Tax=Deinococcus rubellus TaxID=1889240 RepID=UPI0031EDC6E6
MQRHAALFLALSLSALNLNSAQAGHLSPKLQEKANRHDAATIGVLVRFKVDVQPGKKSAKELRKQLKDVLGKLGSANGLFNKLLKNKGKGAELWLDHSVYLKMTPAQAQALAKLPMVEEVFENFQVTVPRASALSVAAAPAGTPWHLQAIGAPQAWAAGFRGQGIRIGHLDTGIDPSNPELAGKLLSFAEFGPDGERINSAPHDSEQHGTHTAGLLVGKSVGVAPAAKLISALVLPKSQGTFAQVIAGMQWVIDPDGNPDTPDGANVVSMSLGLPGTHQEFLQPVRNMLEAGVIPVFAIGNFGPAVGSTGSPGNIPDVIGVGSVNQAGAVSSFSSRGPVTWTGAYSGTFIKPDIVAPGENITSSYPGQGYGSRSGTSQAAPIAAGAVAVLLSARPGLDIAALKSALFQSASNKGSRNNASGYGLINLPGALARLGVQAGDPPRTPVPVPVPVTPAPTPQPRPPVAIPTPTPKPPVATPPNGKAKTPKGPKPKGPKPPKGPKDGKGHGKKDGKDHRGD